MNKPPAFQFYADDFIGGTATMDHAERGFYILALCVQWNTGGIAPDEFARLGRGLVEGSLNHCSTKFQLCEDGLLRNARLEAERAKQIAFREKCSKAGSRSVEGRLKVPSRLVEPTGEPKANSPVSSLQSPNKDKDSRFAPPSIEEVKLYCAKAGIIESDAAWFWYKMDSQDWVNGKKKVKKWGMVLMAWKTAGYLPSQKNGAPAYGNQQQPKLHGDWRDSL
jgi:uncharacterized protein YdaU (DUF1376 family)